MELPLPIVLVVGVSLVLAWEAMHPRTSPLRSSIAREAGHAFLGGQEDPETAQRAALRRQTAAAALRSKMGEISRAPRGRCLTRASTVSTPKHHTSEDSSATPEVGEWQKLEAGAGPLARQSPLKGSVVFFAAHTLEVEASDTEIALTLFRTGDLSHELTVFWSTMDGTALAGVDYEASRGTALFVTGESSAEVRVSLLRGDLICAQRFFVVHIESISGRGTMGSLPFARVRLPDAGEWPPGRPLQPQAEAGWRGYWAQRRAARQLVVAFVLMLVRWRGRRYWMTVFSIMWKDFHQVVMNALLLNFALYDLCLTRADDPAAYRRLPAVVGLKLLLVLLDRLADHIIATMSGTSSCSRFVQSKVLHKYLGLRHDPVGLGHFYHLFFETAPECITFAYKPTFDMIHGIFTVFLSFLMALAVPMLRGHPVSLKTLRPLFGIVALVPLAFILAGPARMKDKEALVQRRRDWHAEACGALQEVLACRHGVRAFDSAYPAQQVRLTFDDAYAKFGAKNAGFAEFKDDTHWVVKYLGESAKLLAMLYGGYAVLEVARTGTGSMTLGQFAVVVSLYGAMTEAFYTFIEAWDGFTYARILLGELSGFLSLPAPRYMHSSLPESAAQSEWLAIKFDLVPLDIELQEGGLQEGGSKLSDPLAGNLRCVAADVPLGCIYAVAAPEGWSSTRRYVGALLGGATSPCQGRLEAPSFVRSLLVSPPASLAEGSVLENLMSYAAAWIRGSDALAVTAALGVPFEAPSGTQPLHDLLPGQLLEVLGSAVAESAEPSPAAGQPRRRFPAANTDEEETLGRAATAFRARMAVPGVTVLSPMSKVESLLRPHELHALDLARGLLADPDTLVVQDTLSMLPAFHASAVLRFLQAWQRLGGLKGVVLAWERARLAEEAPARAPRGSHPAWLTEVGGICRTLVLSESALVTAGLGLRSQVDAWLVVGSDRLEVTAVGD